MTPRTFAGLAATAVAISLLALAVHASSNRWTPGSVSGAKLFPSLAGQAGKVSAIEIGQGEKKLTVVKSGAVWGIKERAGYPVRVEQVRAPILRLSNAELVEPKTRLKDRHALLELEDPTGKDAKSRRVRLLDEKGQSLADIIVGKRRVDAFGTGKSGTYVRRLNEVETWLSNADLELPLEPKDWLLRQVLEIEAGKVARVTLEVAGEEPLTLERDGAAKKDAKYKIAALPEGKKLKAGANVDAIASMLNQIDLDDVRKAETPPADAKVNVARFEADGGLKGVVRIRREKDDAWLTLEVTGDGEAKKTADEIAARTKGWEYKIPTWKADGLFKKRADLLE